MLIVIQSEWYKSWHNKTAGNPGLFAERNEKRHAIRRRHVATAYSMTTIIQLEKYVDSCSNQLIRQFERLAGKGRIDLGEWFQMYGNIEFRGTTDPSLRRRRRTCLRKEVRIP